LSEPTEWKIEHDESRDYDQWNMVLQNQVDERKQRIADKHYDYGKYARHKWQSHLRQNVAVKQAHLDVTGIGTADCQLST